MFANRSKMSFTTHDGAAVMQKTSQLLESRYFQHFCSHSLHLSLMNNSKNKIAAIRDLLKHCKDVVSKLHFKSHLIDEELQKKKLREDVNDLLEKINVANQILEMECRIAVNSVDESLQANDDSNESSLDVDEQAKVCRYRHLQQEVLTCWNSANEMLNSLLALKDEVSESLKRTGNYDLCIKANEWIMISQLCKLLSTFNTFM